MQQIMPINISNIAELTKELDTLLNVSISSNQELENWLIQQSQTLNSINEQLMQHYIAFQRNTNDIKVKEAFDFDQKNVQPTLKRYKSLLGARQRFLLFGATHDCNLIEISLKHAFYNK